MPGGGQSPRGCRAPHLTPCPAARVGGPLSLSSLLETLDTFDLGGDEAEGGSGDTQPPAGGSPPPALRHADSLEEVLLKVGAGWGRE